MHRAYKLRKPIVIIPLILQLRIDRRIKTLGVYCNQELKVSLSNTFLLGHNLHKQALIFHVSLNLVGFLLSYNGIWLYSSCFANWQVCNARVMALDIYGSLWLCASHLWFTAPLTGMDFHSVWQDVGSVYFSELHSITPERHRTCSWMKGNHRFISQLFSSVVTLSVVREFIRFQCVS